MMKRHIALAGALLAASAGVPVGATQSPDLQPKTTAIRRKSGPPLKFTPSGRRQFVTTNVAKRARKQIGIRGRKASKVFYRMFSAQFGKTA